jgi:tRNA 2-(methylsulfanyl)-N6-isopentenyladenosine37 hydroxylase
VLYPAPMLQSKTDPAWVKLAVERFDEVLVDHAHCEKKAAAHALSMLSAYPEVPGLPRAMARLAREEAGHLAMVIALCEKRGLSMGRDPGDPYAQGLLKLLRNARGERLVDQLLVSALIEDRSRERLELLAGHLREPELQTFYGRLALSEKGHGTLFVRFARQVGGELALTRLAELAAAEARLLEALPLRAAVH